MARKTHLDLILFRKDDKMMNLLLSNLSIHLQNIQGFSNFAFNELNVELSPGDVLFLNKLSETETRLVHLIHFRNIEVRNAIYRSRINLGFRSRIWINEDLIPSKEILALGARRRFRVGKISKNWTYQGDGYITMKDSPNPINISKEEDFPPETALKESEGMLPHQTPTRGPLRNNPYNMNHMQANYNRYAPWMAAPYPCLLCQLWSLQDQDKPPKDHQRAVYQTRCIVLPQVLPTKYKLL